MSQPLSLSALVLTLLWAGAATAAEERALAQVPGWSAWALEKSGHQLRLDLEPGRARSGEGCGRIVGVSADNGARACFEQKFLGKTPVAPGKAYRYALAYRTPAAAVGGGKLVIDSYAGKVGEAPAAKTSLVAQSLAGSAEWRLVEGRFTVPADAAQLRFVLYHFGVGTVWFDDALLAEDREGAPNLLANGGFEAPASAVWELAPARGAGVVKLSADFPNGTMGAVKEIGPDEFLVHAFPAGQPHSNFLWFHFRVDGCAGRPVTIHLDPAPFARDRTGGNGTRSPVMSTDQDEWTGVEDKAWNADGSGLTFTLRSERSPVWVASFFPYPPARLERFIAGQARSPFLQASVIGRTPKGRDLRLLTISDPAVPEDGKREVLLMSLQHDLETSGAHALEGFLRFLLGDDPRAAALRRAFVVRAVPVMDPDGIDQGNLYCPVGNMNRQWGLGTTPEVAAVEKLVQDLAARGRRLELFMDFHGWCTPKRGTELWTFGKELGDAAGEAEATRLVEGIKARLSGEVKIVHYRELERFVSYARTDIRRVSEGWMKLLGGARLAVGVEIFGEGECTQQQYRDWGRSFAEAVAGFYGLEKKP
ncbi:MAG: M14-type cytosolic carboxypeptidase [Planctomycetes bacterium]|nr:M14-type cytosolic carboxypeptidase [Planctomycetota bacterium]